MALSLLVLATVLPARAQIFKLPHPDSTIGNFFGNATAIDGNRALVGAIGEDECGENAGAAYIYERDPNTMEWQQVARLAPNDCRAGHFFGRSVALSGDRALVAASGEFFSITSSNAAYVFERDPATGTWSQTSRLVAHNDFEEGSFASSVSLDGNRALVTTTGDPVHGKYGGAAYVFELDVASGQWRQQARLTGSKGTKAGIFGGAGVIDGDRAVVSASTYFRYKPGAVYMFARDPDTGTWSQSGFFDGVDDFFIDIDMDGNTAIVGESKAGHTKSGAATLFVCDQDGTWHRAARLEPKTPYKLGAFGSAVSIKGDTALIVGYDEQLGQDFNIDRVVYVFKRDPEAGDWRQTHIIDIGQVAFGSAVDHDQAYALIGNVSDRKTGSAYVVRIQ